MFAGLVLALRRCADDSFDDQRRALASAWMVDASTPSGCLCIDILRPTMIFSMIFSEEQLKDHDDVVRHELRKEIISLVDSYAEGCREQAIAQGPGADKEMLRGSLTACQFLVSVISMQN